MKGTAITALKIAEAAGQEDCPIFVVSVKSWISQRRSFKALALVPTPAKIMAIARPVSLTAKVVTAHSTEPSLTVQRLKLK